MVLGCIKKLLILLGNFLGIVASKRSKEFLMLNPIRRISLSIFQAYFMQSNQIFLRFLLINKKGMYQDTNIYSQ